MVGDSAIALHWVASALDLLRGRLAKYGGGFFAEAQRSQPYEDLERIGQEMDLLSERMSATLGPEHGAVEAFGGARAAVSDILEAVGRLRDPSANKVADVQKFVDETIEHVEGRRESFDACRDQFMAATRDVPETE